MSDIHLPLPGFPLRHLTVKRALGWLNWYVKRSDVHTRAALDLIVADLKAQNPDHILVSGDLINLGLPTEYVAARAWLQSLGPPELVSLVFGNHDNYVRDDAVTAGLASWRAYAGHDGYGRSIEPEGPDHRLFPYVRKLGPVALIGVNSAIPTEVGFAQGNVGKAQLELLAALLKRTKADGLVRLVMIHHPPLTGLAPSRRALLDAEALSTVLAAEGADLVIYGHNHTEARSTHAGIPVIGGASASAARPHGKEPSARYHLITVTHDGPDALIEIETRGLDTAATHIVHVASERFGSHSAASNQ